MSDQIEQGAVLVDVGDGYGALVVTMPAALVGEEIELVPTGTRPAHSHSHRHDHDTHDHEHTHDGHTHDEHTHDGHTHDGGPAGSARHAHGHEHGLDPEHPPHVAVVNRRLPSGEVVPSLVFGTLVAGRYDLYVRPSGPVQLTVDIGDGEVTQAQWPDDGTSTAPGGS